MGKQKMNFGNPSGNITSSVYIDEKKIIEENEKFSRDFMSLFGMDMEEMNYTAKEKYIRGDKIVEMDIIPPHRRFKFVRRKPSDESIN